MAVLTDLPPELIEQIFHDLGSIDDVHCLGRSCRKMCRIIQRQNLYVLIMRSIISQGSQHRYDHQLCQMLQLHRDVAAKIRNQSTLLFVDRGAPRRWKEDATTEWKERLKAIFAPPMDAGHGNGAILTDNEVYEILARYQGLRFLENTWLCRQVISKGFITADEHDNVDQLLGAFQSLLDHLDTIQSTRSQSHQSSTTNSRTTKSFGPDQRARFHSAITHNWLLNEIRWLFTQFGPVGHVIPVELLEECKDNINSHDNKPLLDNLDQYATFRFLYHHLLPSCSSVLTDRSMSKLPLTFTNDSSLQDVCRARFVTSAVFETRNCH